jgi:hypothetical protein
MRELLDASSIASGMGARVVIPAPLLGMTTRWVAPGGGRGAAVPAAAAAEAGARALEAPCPGWRRHTHRAALGAGPQPPCLRSPIPRRVLTMEWVTGVKLTTLEPPEIRSLVGVGQEAFLVQLLEIGFIHGDPHPGAGALRGGPGRPGPREASARAADEGWAAGAGSATARISVASIWLLAFTHPNPASHHPPPGNLLKVTEGPDAGKLALLDFGLVAEVPAPDREAMISATIHLANRDWNGACVCGGGVAPLCQAVCWQQEPALSGSNCTHLTHPNNPPPQPPQPSSMISSPSSSSRSPPTAASSSRSWSACWGPTCAAAARARSTSRRCPRWARPPPSAPGLLPTLSCCARAPVAPCMPLLPLHLLHAIHSLPPQDLLAATLEIPFSVPPYMSLLARVRGTARPPPAASSPSHWGASTASRGGVRLGLHRSPAAAPPTLADPWPPSIYPPPGRRHARGHRPAGG